MDRRVVLAIILMMAIAIIPATFMTKPIPPPVADTLALTPPPPTAAPATSVVVPETPRVTVVDSTPAESADTILVRSSLYQYGISTRGGRLVEASFPEYRSMVPGEAGNAQILPDGSDLLRFSVVVGRDTLSLDSWNFTPTTRVLDVREQTPLTLRGERNGVGVTLQYTFSPETYTIGVHGEVAGLGPNGGTLLVGMGPSLRNTESNLAEHNRNLGVVTEQGGTQLLRLSSLKGSTPRILSGPFEWVAIKSKYFVTAVLAIDSSASATGVGRIGGVRVVARDTLAKNPTTADVTLTLPISGFGAIDFALYAGPMEQEQLSALGHDFDDVNPYGWKGFRTVIRPVAGAARWLLVWMHDNLALSYGAVLVVFGIMIRVLLWPLNQKAMRSQMDMQAIQPKMKELQDRYGKKDPQKLQKEMFSLYKEHGVNPMGGCWPMLLPMPILFALFFVFQNTIELRGAPFLWVADLSRPDPLYIIPLLMGASMFVVSKLGQVGVTANAQMKMMVYVMPVMMTFLFLNFASGLNLYYAVQNIASIPQQWLLSRERLKRIPPKPTPPKPKAR